MAQKKKGRAGSSFDGFLAEQGILGECEEQALKQILADQITAAMEKIISARQPWLSACKPAAAHSTVCLIRRIPA